jgi:ketosteroid isomerase-like protein
LDHAGEETEGMSASERDSAIMESAVIRIDKIRDFVEALGRSDFEAAVREMTEDVVRIGCYNTPDDIVSGRD